MKIKEITFIVTYRNADGDTGEEYYGCGLEFKVNQKTAKQMVAGMNERELSTMKKAIEERKNKKRVEK